MVPAMAASVLAIVRRALKRRDFVVGLSELRRRSGFSKEGGVRVIFIWKIEVLGAPG